MNKQDAPAETNSERLGQLLGRDGLFAWPDSAARPRVSQIGRAIIQLRPEPHRRRGPS
jgi:hypothetical protein